MSTFTNTAICIRVKCSGSSVCLYIHFQACVCLYAKYTHTALCVHCALTQQSLHWIHAQGVSLHTPAKSSQPAPMGYQSRHLATYFPKQSICPFWGNGANVRLYHSYVQNDLGISIYSNNWCLVFKRKRGENITANQFTFQHRSL